MWVNRNDTLFDKDHIWQKNKRAQWDKKIVAIFDENIRDNFLPEDLRFFRNGKKRVLQLDDNPKLQWIKSVDTARLKKGEKSKQRSRKRDNDLMSWMNTK